MARYKFYGAFSELSDAQKRAKALNATVREIKVNGKTRYTVYKKELR